MKTKLTKLIMLLCAIFFAMGTFNTVEAQAPETRTITITAASAGGTANLGQNAFGGTDGNRPERTWTQGGVGFGAKVFTTNNANVPINPTVGGTLLQSQANNGRIYNTTPFPGRIVSITITQVGEGARNTTAHGGSQRLVNDVVGDLTVREGTLISGDGATGWTSTDLAGTDYRFFVLSRGAAQRFWSDIVIEYEVPAVETPTFDPPAGNVLTSQVVTISTTTSPNAVIHYTTDGSTPTTASPVATDGQVTVTSTTTIRAIAAYNGDESAVASATYTFPINVPDIAAFLATIPTNQTANWTGPNLLRITGDMTFVFRGGRNVFVQDASGSLLIDDPSNVIPLTYNENGQVITGGIIGTPNVFSQRYRMAITAGQTVSAPQVGTRVEPTVTTVGNLLDNPREYESRLVRVVGVEFPAGGTFASAATSLDMTQDGTTMAVRNEFANFERTMSADTFYDVTGFMFRFNAAQQITPRGFADISATPILTVTPQLSHHFPSTETGQTSAYFDFTVASVGLNNDIVKYVTDTANVFGINAAEFDPKTGGRLRITFSPINAYTYGATIMLVGPGAQSSDTVTITLTGHGRLPDVPSLEFEDNTELDFGQVLAGENSSPQTTTVLADNLEAPGISFHLTSTWDLVGNHFTVAQVPGWNGIDGGDLSVTFNPTAAGTFRDTLVVQVEAPPQGSGVWIRDSLPLVGTGIGVIGGAPTAEAATSVGRTSFTANWTPVANATSFTVRVYEGATVGTTPYTTQTAEHDVTSLVITGLTASTQYTFTVTAHGGLNQALTSANNIQVTTVGLPAQGDIIISQIRSRGGPNAAGERWVELFNTTGQPIDLDGLFIWNVTASNPHVVISPTNNIGALTGTIPARGFFLIERCTTGNPTSAGDIAFPFIVSNQTDLKIALTTSNTGGSGGDLLIANWETSDFILDLVAYGSNSQPVDIDTLPAPTATQHGFSRILENCEFRFTAGKSNLNYFNVIAGANNLISRNSQSPALISVPLATTSLDEEAPARTIAFGQVTEAEENATTVEGITEEFTLTLDCLRSDLTLNITGDNNNVFTVYPTTIVDQKILTDTVIRVTFAPAFDDIGEFTATLQIRGTDVSIDIALSGEGIPQMFEVTFNDPANGTLTVMDDQTELTVSGTEVARGTELTITTSADLGFHLDSLSVNKVTFTTGNTHTVAGPTAIYARFAINRYPITFNDPANGTLTVHDGTNYLTTGDHVNHGTSLTIVATPAANHHIAAFTVDNIEIARRLMGASDTIVTAINAITINAEFAIDTFEVRISYAGSGTVTVTRDLVPVDSGSFVPHGTELIIGAEAAGGYRLTSLMVGVLAIDSGDTHVVTGLTTVHAHFTIDGRFGLTLGVYPNADYGTTTGEDDYTENQQVTIEAIPNTGFRFVKWVDALDDDALVSTNNPHIFNMPGDDITFTAVFARDTFPVHFSASEQGGTLTVNDGTRYLTSGDYVPFETELLITATDSLGWHLDELTVNGDSFISGQVHTVGAETTTIFAGFAINMHAITFNDPDYGTLEVRCVAGDTLVNSGSLMPHFAELRITATPDANHHRSLLTVNGTNFESGTIHEVAGATNIVAAFAIDTFAVTFNKPEGGILAVTIGVEPVISGTFVAHGTELTITATPAEGMLLETLTVNGTGFESGTNHTVTATTEIYVVFAPPAPLARWAFRGVPTENFGPNSLAPVAYDRNLIVEDLTRHWTVSTGTAGTDAWGGNNFAVIPVAHPDALEIAIEEGQYISFTVTANDYHMLSLSRIGDYNIRRSNTGPSRGQWQFQIDDEEFVNLGSVITFGGATSPTSLGHLQSAIDLSDTAALQDIAEGTTVTFRLVLWGATAAGGNWHFNDGSELGAPGLRVYGNIVLTGAVETPVLSHRSGNLFETTNVTITAEAGTIIFYSTDVDAPRWAFNPLPASGYVTISENTVLRAIAVVGNDTSAMARATYTFPAINVENIAEFLAESADAPTGTLFRITGDLTFVWRPAGNQGTATLRNNVYVKDETGGLLILDNVAPFVFSENYAPGDLITSGLIGRRDLTFGQVRMIPTPDQPALSPAGTPSELSVDPIEITMEDLLEDVVDLNARLVRIIGVEFTENTTFTADTALTRDITQNGETMALRSHFQGVEIAVTTTELYDVTGFVWRDFRNNEETHQIVVRNTGDITVNTTPSLSFATNTMEFSNQNINTTSAVQTVMITGRNLGDNIIIGYMEGEDADYFEAIPAAGEWNPLTGGSVEITFRPLTKGPKRAVLFITSGEGQDQLMDSIVLTGTGVDPASLCPRDIEEAGVVLFPNPVQDVLNIQTTETISVVRIYNLAGQVIVQQQGNVNSVDVSVLPHGTYVVRITFDNGTVLSRVIVK